jgi:hypothetical protein
MSLTSKSFAMDTISLEGINEKIGMVPFDMATLAGVPDRLKSVIQKIIGGLPKLEGKAFLTVHTKDIEPNTTHRRGGAHIDGNYIESLSWCTTGGNGWKVGGDGLHITPEEHILSYETKTGGMLIVSDYPACAGWNGEFKTKAKEGGDCSHLNLDPKDGFIMEPNRVYYGTSQFIHESLPISEKVTRTLIRITLPANYPYLEKKS